MTGKDITLGVPSKKRHQDRKTETKLTIQCMHSHTDERGATKRKPSQIVHKPVVYESIDCVIVEKTKNFYVI